jgi:uncharacterized metal-binding protein YceD (DUF177 family)
MTPEFSRPVRIDTIGDEPRAITISAEPKECVALAARFGLVGIDRLEADFNVHRTGETIHAEGRLRGQAIQSCVATGEPLAAVVDTAFSLRFVPDSAGEPGGEEVELSDADCDVLTYADGAVDLGEAAAETLLLALDPFPRSANADAVLKAAGVLAEDEAGPFAALKGLRDKLGKA